LFRLILMSFLALRLLGGDVAMLQIVAWTGMIVTRTAERGIAAAVESTFDGDEPCPLCKAVKAVTQSEPAPLPANPDQLVMKLKLNDMVKSGDLLLPCPSIDQPQTIPLVNRPEGIPRARCDAPALPPPKFQVA
jgi:hypothetical protein